VLRQFSRPCATATRPTASSNCCRGTGRLIPAALAVRAAIS
jgi:hypothetical protein